MFRLLLAAAAATLVASPLCAAAPGPVDTIKAVYAADAPFMKNTGPGVMGDDKLRARFFSKALLGALKKDEATADKNKEPPTIEGDPFVDSQEPGTRDIRVSLISATAGKAKVLANFDRGDGTKGREDVTYSMVLEGGMWRIDDIAYRRPDGTAEDTIRKDLGLK